MATNQVLTEEITAMISAEEKAAVEKLIKDAADEIKNKADDLQGETVTSGILVNRNFKDVFVVGKHDWSGNATVPYPALVPPTEPADDYVRFEHRGPLPGGSKGGVVYADGEHVPTARKWIVAFDRVNNKAYIEAGPIGPVDWNVVEAKLNASAYRSQSGDSYCLYHPGGIFVAVFHLS